MERKIVCKNCASTVRGIQDGSVRKTDTVKFQWPRENASRNEMLLGYDEYRLQFL